MSTCLVDVGDLHVGSTLGLLAPGTAGEDGMTVGMSRGQAWLYDCWRSFWSQVWTLKTKYRRRLIVALSGDLCDGDGNTVVQRWTRDLRVQVDAAHKLLGPIAQMADVTYVTRGTPFHNRNGGQADADVAERIKAAECQGQRAAYHLRLRIEDVFVDIAHHVGRSRLPWTAGGNVGRLAAQVRDHAADGVAVPDLVIRSHAHLSGDSGAARKPRVIVTPCWQLATEFVHMIDSVAVADIGGVIVQIDGADFDATIRRFLPESEEYVSV